MTRARPTTPWDADAGQESTERSGPMSPLRRFSWSSGRVRFQQYTKVGLYTFGVLECPLILVWAFSVQGVSPWVRILIIVVGLGHIGALWWLIRHALQHYLGNGPLPVRALGVALAVTVGGQALAALLILTDRTPTDAVVVITWFPMFFAGPAMLTRSMPRGAALAAFPVALSVPVVLAFDSPQSVPSVLYLLVGVGAFAVTFRTSAWSLRILQELEEAQQTQGRLAVAEERLRFSRDMHDVLGRNLSVIALKSELAQQLAQRGSPTAGDQMIEVQRIARESQQEMRAVLRGYREADLHTEIAGARGVLEAAGVTCTVLAAPSSADLPADIRMAFGWVVREGTTNVLRHSDARTCTLRLDRERSGAVVLTVENDGVRTTEQADGDADAPTPADETSRAGSGLTGLRERLTALDGTLTAAPGPRATYRLIARLPVTAKG